MINSVEMINWRAFDHKKVAFAPGITFIMGPNGAGKTSILEAIAYALTGSASTVKERSKLLRDPGTNATVRLEFSINGDIYVVERSQSLRRTESATILRNDDPTPLASNTTATTNFIENLTGVSTEFLQRIIYMAEGDVFRFLNDPPGKALDYQIRNVLGLTQLDELVKAVGLAKKQISEQIANIRTTLDQFSQIGISNDANLNERLGEIDKKRSKSLASLKSAQTEIDSDKKENEELLRLKPLLNDAIQALSKFPPALERAKEVSVINYYSALEKEKGETQLSITEAEKTLARLGGERNSSQNVLEVLSPLVDSSDTVPCPVCTKPMTVEEREDVIADLERALRRNDEKTLVQSEALKESRRLEKEAEGQLLGIRELRNFLTHVSLRGTDQSATVDDLRRLVASEVDAISTRIREKQAKLSMVEDDIKKLEDERAEFSALQTRLSHLGYSSINEATNAFVNLEIRSLSLRAANTAVQKTLTSQRDEDMRSIYSQISSLWGGFAMNNEWQMQLDDSGMPTLQNGEGRNFDLSQLSGGEKTALLVILHTIIARHFSKTDFLLIDEPLEHLDPVNRRSLLRYLTNAYKNEAFEQLIITTFEESLTRKYINESGVEFIHV